MNKHFQKVCVTEMPLQPNPDSDLDFNSGHIGVYFKGKHFRMLKELMSMLGYNRSQLIQLLIEQEYANQKEKEV